MPTLRPSCRSSLLLALLAASFSLNFVGCGGGSTVRLAPASGTVQFDGAPVANADVTFFSEGAPVASARTDAQGRYVLGTYKPGDGAPVGNHKVTVTKKEKPANQKDDPYAAMIDLLPAAYSQQATTPLAAEVKASDSNDIPLNVTSKGGKS